MASGIKHKIIDLPAGEWAFAVHTGKDDEVCIFWSNGRTTTGQHDSGFEDLCCVISSGLTHDQCTGLAPRGPETVPYSGHGLWQRKGGAK